LRRYAEMHGQLASNAPPLQSAVSYCVDGSVVGLRTGDALLLALFEPGMPAGLAHRAAEGLAKTVGKAKSRLVMSPIATW
jgi:hypothetical protein